MASVTNWIKKNIVSRYMMSSCPNEQKCLQALHEILDNESSSELEAQFQTHLDSCWTCFKNYNLEVAIRELIKTKIDNKPVPEGLLDKIKTEIDKSTKA